MARQSAFAARGLQVPSNKATALDLRASEVGKTKPIDYDHLRLGKPAERQRIIKWW